MDQLISEHKGPCINQGCQEILTNSQRIGHERVCKFQSTPCIKYGCHSMVQGGLSGQIEHLRTHHTRSFVECEDRDADAKIFHIQNDSDGTSDFYYFLEKRSTTKLGDSLLEEKFKEPARLFRLTLTYSLGEIRTRMHEIMFPYQKEETLRSVTFHMEILDKPDTTIMVGTHTHLRLHSSVDSTQQSKIYPQYVRLSNGDSAFKPKETTSPTSPAAAAATNYKCEMMVVVNRY